MSDAPVSTYQQWGLRDPGLSMQVGPDNDVREFTGMWKLNADADLPAMAAAFAEDWFLPLTAKLGLIRTARWFVARTTDFDGWTLFFVSHFDGSLAKYFDDFVYNGKDNLLKIWGQCAGCPTGPDATARDVVGFIARGQIRTLACYDGFPDIAYNQIARLADHYRKTQDFQRAVSRGGDLEKTVSDFLTSLAEPAPLLPNQAVTDPRVSATDWQYTDVAERVGS
jgi:hypothetical protein